jgi:hypothetical protein
MTVEKDEYIFVSTQRNRSLERARPKPRRNMKATFLGEPT